MHRQRCQLKGRNRLAVGQPLIDMTAAAAACGSRCLQPLRPIRSAAASFRLSTSCCFATQIDRQRAAEQRKADALPQQRLLLVVSPALALAPGRMGWGAHRWLGLVVQVGEAQSGAQRHVDPRRPS